MPYSVTALFAIFVSTRRPASAARPFQDRTQPFERIETFRAAPLVNQFHDPLHSPRLKAAATIDPDYECLGQWHAQSPMRRPRLCLKASPIAHRIEKSVREQGAMESFAGRRRRHTKVDGQHLAQALKRPQTVGTTAHS